MPRIQPPGFYLFLEVESGGSIRGGFKRGGFNKFHPEGEKIFTFFIRTSKIELILSVLILFTI